MNEPRHFITGTELRREELQSLIGRGRELKRAGVDGRPLENRSVAMLLARPSTRTRASFEVGIAQLGGKPVVLRADELQLARGESPRDTALVLSRYVDAIVARPGSDATIEELARHAEVPVVNALTPLHHPCQALADLMTLEERFGSLEGLRVAYVGDGNNVAASLAFGAALSGVELVVASPESYELDGETVARVRNLGGAIELVTDPYEAVRDADAVYTDVWTSMGQEAERERRLHAFVGFTVDDALMKAAAPDAVFLHCLPAHRGEEVAAEVIDGPRSLVWQQAANRMHAARALLVDLVEDGE